MERPGIKLPTWVPVYAFAVSEGAVWGAGAVGILTQSLSIWVFAGSVVGAVVGLCFARYYKSQNE